MSYFARYNALVQIDQLFEFVYVLIDKKQATAKEMAKRFGVSTRTIYRWMEALSVSSVPVYALKGRGGGIAIEESYTLDKRLFSEEERLAIVSSVKALGSLGGNFAGTAASKVALKLSSLSKNDADWLEVDFAPWSPEGSEVRTLFATLRDSILKKRQVVFDYCSSQGKVEQRTAQPWKLVFRGQAWYLYAWCEQKKDERFFKLSRMRNARQTARAVTAVPKEKSAPYPASPNPQMIKVKATVAAQKISFLLDAFVCQEMKVRKDKSASVVFTAPDEPWLCDFLLSFGPDLKVLSPESIKKKILSLAKETAKVYK